MRRGETVLPPELASALPPNSPAGDQRRTVLTDREAEILRLIAAGKTLPAIAKELFLA